MECKLDPENLTMHSLDTQADIDTFNRFDNFNALYNPFGDSSLRAGKKHDHFDPCCSAFPPFKNISSVHEKRQLHGRAVFCRTDQVAARLPGDGKLLQHQV